MKRFIFMIIFITILMFPINTYTMAPASKQEQYKEEIQTELDNQLQSLDIGEWDTILQKLPNETRTLFDGVNIQQLLKSMISGNFTFDYQKILQNISSFFLKEITVSLGLMIKIIVLTIMCGIIHNMQSSFVNESIGEIAYFATYILIITLIVQSLIILLGYGKDAISSMVSFMQLLFPILLTFLIALGGIASSTIFQPAIALLVGAISTFIRDVILPLLLVSAILTMINHISDKIQLSKLAGLIKSICTWMLGIIFTIYIGVLTVQGLVAASFDGVSIRTAKFAIDTFVPIVGSMFSDSIDAIVGCSLLIKNAVGVVGLVILALICIFPALKILAMIFLYRATSALLEPIGDIRVPQCLNDIANIITILFVTVISVGVLLFITIALLIGAGNMTVMMR